METMEARLDRLEARIVSLEQDRDRLLKAMNEAAEKALENPVIATMLPKEIKQGLREHIAKVKANGTAA